MHYSLDLRKRVINAVENGMKQLDAAEIFGVSTRTIYNWVMRKKETGNLEPITGFQKGHSHKITDLDHFKIFVDQHPDFTQEEIAHHFSVHPNTIGRALKKIDYTRKKRASSIKSGAKKNARYTWIK